ncbi:MAG: GNAT family protein [Myxococcota bacterium]
MGFEPSSWALCGATLRRLVPSDAQALLALVDANRGHLRPWMDWEADVRCLADTTHFIQSARALGPRGPTAYECGIFEDRSGALAGAVGLNGIELDKGTANLGYWLAATHEGRGWVSAAAGHLARFGFEVLDLHRIEIRAAVGNLKSQNVAQRAGFTREGTLRNGMLVAGVRHDVAVFSRVPDDPSP